MQAGDLVADRFLLEAQAGSGGMGAVFRARDLTTDGLVAVKILTADSELDSERFIRESNVLEELQHPGIVRHIAHGTTASGCRFLAMEWLEGEDLGQRLTRGPLIVAEAIAIVRSVAEALAVAHARGIIHRDIKPGNVFLVGASIERVLLLDFGIARFSRARQDLTQAGTIVGTPNYMAPEQARGDPDLDVRVDVHALGCLLFATLIGHSPYRGSNSLAVLARILVDEPPRLSSFRTDVPETLESLVARMLAKSRGARPADAGAVARELAQIGASDVEPLVAVQGLTAAERRVVCIVLAGGSLATRATLAYREDTHLIATDDRIADALSAQGAHVQLLANGSILATVSGTGSAADHASRAARCAMLLRPLTPGWPIVVATGLGVVGGTSPVGPVIDRAVALLDARAGADIVVDKVTADLLQGRFAIEASAQRLLLRGELQPDDSARLLLGKLTPCVGRDREIGVLEALLAEAAEEATARVAVLTGAPGSGKSRIRHELTRRMRDRSDKTEILVGVGDSLTAGSPFAILASMIRRSAAIADGEPIAERRTKLRARIARHVEPDEVQRMTEFIGEMVGIAFPDDASVGLRAARADAQLRGDAMLAAFEDWLMAEAQAHPVLLIVEDLQWGDVPSVKFVNSALRNLKDQPLVVLGLARPEAHDLFPDLWADHALTTIRLGELGRRASERLIREVFGTNIDTATIERLTERAHGNAFYLEELIRVVATDPSQELPETVLGMVQNRLDALGDDARRLLRAASIFGQRFRVDGVARLLGEDRTLCALAESLDELAAGEVLRRTTAPSSAAGEREYAFRHELVRETAYASLTDEDRTLGHRLAGQWLEEVGGADAVALAEHFVRGKRPERAVAWYHHAAEQALEGNDFAAVFDRADAGIACGASREALGQLRLCQADAHAWRGEHAQAEARATEAFDNLPPGGAAWFQAATCAIESTGNQGKSDALVGWIDIPRAFAHQPGAVGARIVCLCRGAFRLIIAGRYDDADSLLELAETLADDPEPLAKAQIHRVRAIRAVHAGNPAAVLTEFQLAHDAFAEAGNARNVCAMQVNIGSTFAELGDFRQAEHWLRQALASAERMGLHNVTGYALDNLGFVLAHLGQFDEARSIEQRAIDAGRRQGDPRLEGTARICLAVVGQLSGDLAAAERESRKAVELLETASPHRAAALAVLCRALLGQDRAAEALAAAHESMRHIEELGGIDEFDSLARLAYADALKATGDREGALAALRDARSRLTERAQRISDAALRQSFLQGIPEHRRTLAISGIWLTE